MSVFWTLNTPFGTQNSSFFLSSLFITNKLRTLFLPLSSANHDAHKQPSAVGWCQRHVPLNFQSGSNLQDHCNQHRQASSVSAVQFLFLISSSPQRFVSTVEEKSALPDKLSGIIFLRIHSFSKGALFVFRLTEILLIETSPSLEPFGIRPLSSKNLLRPWSLPGR